MRASAATADSESASAQWAGASADSAAAGPQYPDVGVIALLPEAWGWHWTSRHQILMRLARFFHVLWVNPPQEWRTVIGQAKRLPSEVHVPGQSPYFTIHNSAPWLPLVYRPAWVGTRLARARLREARARLEQRGCKRIVLYLWHPSLASALSQGSYDLSCYHIYDEYSHAAVEQPLDPTEVELIRSVDQVFIASPILFKRKGALNPHSLWVPNGVEFEAFSTPVDEPEDLASVSHPRIGYSGFLKKQLDWPLLAELARRHSEWSFVFVGARRPHPEIDGLLSQMAMLANVHFLGDKTASELARYPQHFDVCLMPYRVDDYTKYIYPLKLHEYLASGRPTVGTRLPVLEEVKDVVILANTLAEWELGITRALAVDACSPVRRAERQDRARQHDWGTLAARIAGAIIQRLDQTAVPQQPALLQHTP